MGVTFVHRKVEMKNLIIILLIMALIVGVISYIYSAPLLYIIWEMR